MCYYRLQKGSHMHVFQNATSKGKRERHAPANRHVLSLYSSRTVLCVNRGKKRDTHPLERFSPVCGLVFHSGLDRGPIHSHVFFKTELYKFHFMSSSLFFFSFHVNMLKQLNLQAMLLAQRQNNFSEFKSQSGLTHRTLN